MLCKNSVEVGIKKAPPHILGGASRFYANYRTLIPIAPDSYRDGMVMMISNDFSN